MKGWNMSNTVNTSIYERAYEMAEECTNSVLGGQLEQAIDTGNLEEILTATKACEDYLTYQESLNDEVQ
jgi:hypothetical protein